MSGSTAKLIIAIATAQYHPNEEDKSTTLGVFTSVSCFSFSCFSIQPSYIMV